MRSAVYITAHTLVHELKSFHCRLVGIDSQTRIKHNRLKDLQQGLDIRGQRIAGQAERFITDLNR